ncbi:MAG: SAM-dependent methyltransferase, partial [Pseudomonadota bacterium]
FLDALPIRQFVFMDGRWSERVVGLSAQGELMWGLREGHDDFSKGLSSISEGKQGAVFEFSAARANLFQQMVGRAADQGGAVLMIDYGHDIQSGTGDTFQAVLEHKFVDVLTRSGNADLTSHVNFGVLHHIAKSHKTKMSVRLDSQRQFLCAMGIEGRAAQLSKNASAQQKIDLELALSRLIDEDKMGHLFRVIEVCDEKTYS